MTLDEDLALRQITQDMNAYHVTKTHDLGKMLQVFEQEQLRSALQLFNGNRTHTAEYLNISRTNLIAKIKKYNIE